MTEAQASSPFELAGPAFEGRRPHPAATDRSPQPNTSSIAAEDKLAADTVASSARAARSRLLLLPELDEPIWKRRLFGVLALAITLAFFLMVLAFFAPGPGTPGIDENAYLVGGTHMAQHLSPGIHPSNPFSYVGPMWIRAADGWYYPKYPAGVPLLNALAIWVTGGHSNLAAVYVSPICAALAVAGMFLLTRAIAGSFFALLAALALATNSTMLHLALVPSSHAPDICFVLGGMFALLCWWRSGKLWMGIAAGFLLGYAVTIRYSEALLLFPFYPLDVVEKHAHPIGHKLFYLVRFLPVGPIGLAAIASVRWRRRDSYLRAAVPLLAWAVPVAALVWFNWRTLHTVTGYDSTRESTGFTLEEFKSKWEYTVQELHLYGLFFLLPIGLLGMLLMFSRVWRLALWMVLWLVPSLVLYTAYYWGQQAPGVGYLRFFLALYPPVIASAMWLIATATRSLVPMARPEQAQAPRPGSIAIPIGAGLFTSAVVAAGLYVSLPDMERQHVQNQRLAYSARALLDTTAKSRREHGGAPPIFFAEDNNLLMYLQFVADGEWYSASAFMPGGGGRGMLGGRGPGGGRPAGGRFGGPGRGDPGTGADADTQPPVLIDPQRTAYTQEIYGKMTAADLNREEGKVLKGALDAGRPIYALVSPSTASDFGRRMKQHGLGCKTLGIWKEPSAAAVDSIAPVNNQTRGALLRGMFGGPGGGPPGGGPPGGGPPGGGRGGRFMPQGDRAAGGLAPPSRGRMMEGAEQMLQLLEVTRSTTTVQPAAASASATKAP